MKRRAYIDVNVPRGWQKFFDEALKDVRVQKELELKGFRATHSGLGSCIIQEWLLEHTSMRFEHLNVFEDHVSIVDKKIRHVVDVYFKNPQQKIWCSYCQKSECEHICFALGLEEVKKALKKKGWNP